MDEKLDVMSIRRTFLTKYLSRSVIDTRTSVMRGKLAGLHIESHLKAPELTALGKTFCHFLYSLAMRMLFRFGSQGLRRASQGVFEPS